MENQKKNTTNYELYKLDAIYKDDTNLIKYIDEAQNFYNGIQYPNENYKNMIRVSINFCSFAATIKASKICGTPIYLAYTADNQDTDCNALRLFDEYNCSKMQLKTSNLQAALNGFVNGTEITYIVWDEDDTTYKGIYKGGLKEEHIDLRNFAVANPYIKDIQNQKWVEFWEDYSVGELKSMVEGNSKEDIQKKRELIEREGSNENEYKIKDAVNHGLCRMFTRFFRIDGEVYFTCSTENVDLFLYPHPLSRMVSKEIIKKVIDEYKRNKEKVDEENADGELVHDLPIDYEDLVISSAQSKVFEDREYKNLKEKFSLYPFAIFRPSDQNRSFYGRSDIKSLIPIQKGYNFAISMTLKCAENNAYNKVFAKPDALRGQLITNEPGQTVIDYSTFTNGWGIKLAESQPMPNGLIENADRMLSTARVIYGFNDVMDGSISNQDISGYAMQQMIKQSNTSIEQQMQKFWTYNEDKAYIRLMYYKHYVDEAKYTEEIPDDVYEMEEEARKIIHTGVAAGKTMETIPNAKPEMFEKPTHKVKIHTIKHDDIYGINFDISIDAIQGAQDSKLIEQQTFDNLLLNGGINNISPEILDLYLQASPNVSPRTKASLKRVVEKLKQGKIAQLQAALQQQAAKTEELAAYAQQLESVNGYQGTYLKNLQTEFGNKINESNKINASLMTELDKSKAQKNAAVQMSEGEVKSNNARGINDTAFAK